MFGLIGIKLFKLNFEFSSERKRILILYYRKLIINFLVLHLEIIKVKFEFVLRHKTNVA